MEIGDVREHKFGKTVQGKGKVLVTEPLPCLFAKIVEPDTYDKPTHTINLVVDEAQRDTLKAQLGDFVPKAKAALGLAADAKFDNELFKPHSEKGSDGDYHEVPGKFRVKFEKKAENAKGEPLPQPMLVDTAGNALREDPWNGSIVREAFRPKMSKQKNGKLYLSFAMVGTRVIESAKGDSADPNEVFGGTDEGYVAPDAPAAAPPAGDGDDGGEDW